MKILPIYYLVGLMLLFSSCSQKKSRDKAKHNDNEKLNPTIAHIIKAHGGIEKWEKQNTLTYQVGKEKQTIDLTSRQVKIEASNYAMGNDKGTIWIKQDSTYFKGSPVFHHSLMFYFHAIPFVFADQGINYKKVANKQIKGTLYKGLKITFDPNIGDASNDQYIIYYHPKTYKMEWLAYNSTFGSSQRSENFNLIHYQNWENANGLLLANQLQWYQYSNGKVGSAKGDPVKFEHTRISPTKMGDHYYRMHEGAKIESTDSL